MSGGGEAGMGFISYRSPKTVGAESVYQFLHGAVYGAAWGLVSPFPAAGTPAAVQEAATGLFRPVPPFSIQALSSIPSNALLFGSIMGVQRLSAKSMELLRHKEDLYNDLAGFAVIWPYYRYILNYSEQRLALHNRLVAASIVLCVGYANVLA